ncbi:transmembrane protein, putative (macronuclear) [Tetrahymena thermophila SB210]|uniref:Transmembrane protein, putative n=1 Tax=Tetrahymena thermophila (strain SB210) TaxID=312017 RepID=A4VF49_TETTS|nr:transmembrane protein, putative [Tetrahymena thermophila SB210]EDK31251.1 transmembrane protein, putative [Tetrahymena thermophila SB210]|eukprot:XP_001471503.1 transmembrane protein, putative [Tetrahymena thermophila SB210]
MHQITIGLIIVLVPLIIILSYKIGQKKQQKEIERIQRQEMAINFLKQRASYQSPRNNIYDQAYGNYNQCVQQDYQNQYTFNKNYLNIPPLTIPEPYSSYDYSTYSPPFQPNKRLSFTNFANLNNSQQYEQYDYNIVKQILGPSPPQSQLNTPNKYTQSCGNYYQDNVPYFLKERSRATYFR